MIDVFTLLTVVIAFIAGAAVIYVYNNHRTAVVDKVYKNIKTLFAAYGSRIKADDPELYKELANAISVMDKAMEDKEITLLEAFDIISAYIPLSSRFVKFIKEKYEN